MLIGTLDAGYEGVLSFALNDDCGDGPIYGCTDPTALNYNENDHDSDSTGCYKSLCTLNWIENRISLKSSII